MRLCKSCGGGLVEDVLTGLMVCGRCGVGWTASGRKICKPCVEGDCDLCGSWRGEECSHECFLQLAHGRVEDVGFITAGDY